MFLPLFPLTNLSSVPDQFFSPSLPFSINSTLPLHHQTKCLSSLSCSPSLSLSRPPSLSLSSSSSFFSSILSAEGITLFEIITPDDDKLEEDKLRISKSTVGDAIGMTFPISDGIAGHVARTGETLNIRDPYSDPRFNPKADKEKGFTTNSLLCVPVFQHQQVVAVIQAVNKRTGGHFTEDDENLLQYLSESTGISLAQAALLGQVMRDRRQAQVDQIFIEVLSKRCR